MQIPKPSQLDDWNLYEQLERDKIRQTEGKVKFDDWTSTRKTEKIERDHWRRSREFKIGIRDLDKAGTGSSRWWFAGGGGQPQPQRRRLSDIDTDLLPPTEVPEEEE